VSPAHFDYDWLVVGSGFGGSVSALRLAEKGYRVAVLEKGRRYTDEDLPTSASDRRAFLWAPALGWRGIMRMRLFKDLFTPTQTGVGGGSLVYGGVLLRARPAFFDDPQWPIRGPWADLMEPHYRTAERMLGAVLPPFASTNQRLAQAMVAHLGHGASFTQAPAGVFFGEPGRTVADPYFDGEGPDRTGCTRCGSCMVGCRVGAVNSLTKNYLWFAEKLGVTVMAERSVTDVAPIGAADGRDGYRVTTRRPGPWSKRDIRSYTARGVVLAGGTLGTNELLANCKAHGSLPRLSNQLGELVRTNSESILTVRLPYDRQTWNDVTASTSIQVDDDTTIEFLTYGRNADVLGRLYTVLVSNGGRVTRPLRWLATVATHPRDTWKTLRVRGWSERTVILLVMQALDNAIALRPKRRRSGRGYKLVTEQHRERPTPTYIEAANRAAQWLAGHTGGVAQSNLLEAVANIPTTVHLIGGAVVSSDVTTGVIDENLHVHGYQNLLVCDGSAMPANPGVNPALTITALAEHAMASITPA
jgi:cholesterol oxidase